MSKHLKVEVKNGKIKEAINFFLIELLKKNLVSALLVPRELPSKDNVVQSLVSQPDELKNADVFAPVLPVNSARIISEMTRLGSGKASVGAILRSCEIRALIELVKLKQASLDNLLIIGIDCPGTYSVKDYKALCQQGIYPEDELFKNLKKGMEDVRIREACKVCEYPVPSNSDLTFGFLGVDFEKNIFFQANTSKGEKILDRFSYLEFDGLKIREEFIFKYLKQKIKKRDELFALTQKEVKGWENLISFFSACINCHNCMKVCPVCYCRECFFESACFEFNGDKYLNWAKKKGSIKMPKDTALFHLGRMAHMATSCVGCGACEEACPNNIPLLKVFKTVAHNVQEIFQYVPGKKLQEPLPLTTFKEDELQRVGED
ncbi:4Fe-4S binding protein [Candidatus Aerophobetes bacterium]|nr:4Fe-4S binding protein [Candidatus Aerophobetes bacterium]